MAASGSTPLVSIDDIIANESCWTNAECIKDSVQIQPNESNSFSFHKTDKASKEFSKIKNRIFLNDEIRVQICNQDLTNGRETGGEKSHKQVKTTEGKGSNPTRSCSWVPLRFWLHKIFIQVLKQSLYFIKYEP